MTFLSFMLCIPTTTVTQSAGKFYKVTNTILHEIITENQNFHISFTSSVLKKVSAYMLVWMLTCATLNDHPSFVYWKPFNASSDHYTAPFQYIRRSDISHPFVILYLSILLHVLEFRIQVLRLTLHERWRT
jgi:hypothetical protein